MGVSLAVGLSASYAHKTCGRRKTLKRRAQVGNPFNLRRTLNDIGSGGCCTRNPESLNYNFNIFYIK
jgi:hypothetical protein